MSDAEASLPEARLTRYATPTAKAAWLTEFTAELQRLRASMDGKIGTSIAMLEWATTPDADPLQAAREWAAKRPANNLRTGALPPGVGRRAYRDRP